MDGGHHPAVDMRISGAVCLPGASRLLAEVDIRDGGVRLGNIDGRGGMHRVDRSEQIS